MLDALFTAANGFLHLHDHAGLPRNSPVLGTEFAADHGSNLMSCGDHKLQNFFQLTSWCVVMVALEG